MDRRTFVILVAGTSLLEPLAAYGQPQGRTARVGFLITSPREALPLVVGTIVDRLRELGYVEGRNVIFDFRHADSEERFRELASQLVAVGSRVIFAQGVTQHISWTGYSRAQSLLICPLNGRPRSIC